MKNEFFKSLTNSILFFALLATLTIMSCQKESLKDVATNEKGTTENQTEIDIATVTLQAIYGFQEGELTQTETDDFYSKLMSNLTEDEKAQLDEYVQSYLSRSEIANSYTQVGTRSAGSETILSEGTPGDGFGSSIAKQGNTLFVGAPGINSVHVYENNSLTQTLTASNGAAGFGSRVTASANKLAVSAPGHIYIFGKQGNSWVEQDIITPDADFVGSGGTGTDIVMHGNKLAVLGRTGTASTIFVYKLTGNSWSQEAEIDMASTQTFFWDIDMHDNRIVGNGGDGQMGPFLAPQVYIFEKSGNNWGLETQVAFPADYLLTRQIAIDNSTIVANTAFGALGATNSIIITPSGGSWAISGGIEQPGPLPFADRLLDIQGSKIVVGAPTFGFFLPFPPFILPQGDDVVHVFENEILTETLTPSSSDLDHAFGASLLLSGNKVIIGSPNFPGTVAGEVVIYD